MVERGRMMVKTDDGGGKLDVGEEGDVLILSEENGATDSE